MNPAPLLLPRPSNTSLGHSLSPGWQSTDHQSSFNDTSRFQSGQQQYPPTLSSQSDGMRPLPVLKSSSFADQTTPSDWRTLPSSSTDLTRNGYNSTLHGRPMFDGLGSGSQSFQNRYSQGYSTINAGSNTRILPSSNWNHTVGKYTSAAQLVTRRRAVRACRHCRRRKIRCSGANQSKDGRCENCERAGIERCIFSSVTNETQKDNPTQTMWQQSTLPPDVQLCGTYGESQRHSKQVRPPGFPQVLWPTQQQGHHTIGPQFFASPPFVSQAPPMAHFPVLPQDGSARKRSYHDSSLAAMPSVSQTFDTSPSPFAANFWTPTTSQDQYLSSPSNNWPTENTNTMSRLSPSRRDSKHSSLFDPSQTGIDFGDGTQKRLKSSSGRMLSSILPSIESTSSA